MFGLLLRALVSAVFSPFRSRAALELESLALRHQLAVYQRTCTRPRLKPADRIFWSWFSIIYSGWRDALVFVQPQTITAWRRRKFREHWTKLTRSGKLGRPAMAKEMRDVIRRMSSANPLWGSPRILGELSRIGIVVAKSTVEKYMIRRRKPPSPSGCLTIRRSSASPATRLRMSALTSEVTTPNSASPNAIDSHRLSGHPAMRSVRRASIPAICQRFEFSGTTTCSD